MNYRAVRGVAICAVVCLAPRLLSAQSGYIGNDWLGYGGGSLTAYNSLTDATNHTNATLTTAFPVEDFSVFFVNNNQAFVDDVGGGPASEAIFLTNWFASADGNDDGTANPYNNSIGFMQLYDADASTVTASRMGWTDPTLTSFALNASGGPTVTGCDVSSDFYAADDCGRLWNGQTSANGGSFLDWNISLAETYATSATYNSATGVFESDGKPVTASGQVSGTFFDPTANAWYDFSVPINNVSTFAEGVDTDDLPVAGGMYITPEPATMSLMAFGLVGLAGAVRRRKTR